MKHEQVPGDAIVIRGARQNNLKHLNVASIFEDLLKKGDARLVITFPVPIPKNFSEKEVEELLQRQGYTRLHSRSASLLGVIQDRVQPSP